MIHVTIQLSNKIKNKITQFSGTVSHPEIRESGPGLDKSVGLALGYHNDNANFKRFTLFRLQLSALGTVVNYRL